MVCTFRLLVVVVCSRLGYFANATKKMTIATLPTVGGGYQREKPANHSIISETGKTMISASFVFGMCGVYEIAEGFVAARAAHTAHQDIGGVIGVLISKSLHGVMDELVTCYLLGTAGQALIQLGSMEDIATSRKESTLVVGIKSIRTLVKRLRGATSVLLVKKVLQAILIRMGLKGLGPQALTPFFRHPAGHHHAEIEALEKALGAGDMIEKNIDSFIEANPL